jgi:hypothetical protein
MKLIGECTMRQSNHWIGLALIMATLPYLGGPLQAATARKDEPSHVEPIPGSKLNRVALKASAVERLGIETTTVRETVAARKRLVAAEVLDAAEVERVGLRTAAGGPGRGERIQVAAGVSEAPAGARTEAGSNLPPAGAYPSSTMEAPRAWVRVLSISDAPKVARDQPALVMPLIRGSYSNALPSRLVSPSVRGAHDADPTLYYVIDGPGPALPATMRVLIELPFQASQRRIVPHSAVFYDEHGQAWVYTNPEPLVFIRHPIQVDYVDQDQAFLSDGPAPGAEIVKIGAARLYGVEFGVGH